MEIVRLLNKGTFSASVAAKGHVHVVKPGMVGVFDPHIAHLLLEKYKDTLEAYQTTPTVDATIEEMAEGAGLLWLYNNTGNPLCPAKADIKVLRDKKWQMVEIDHPLKMAREIKFVQQGGTDVWEQGTRNGGLTFPPREYRIEPFRRKALPKHAATTLLRREAGVQDPYRGAIRKSREPGSWDPNLSWSILDLVTYWKYLTPELEKAKSPDFRTEEAIRKQAGAIDNITDSAVLKYKEFILSYLFFYVADPRVKLPQDDELQELLKHPVEPYVVPMPKLVSSALQKASILEDIKRRAYANFEGGTSPMGTR